jgi:hypothetical protein
MRDLHDEEEEDDDDEGKAEGCYAEVRQAGLLIYNRGTCLCYTVCAVLWYISLVPRWIRYVGIQQGILKMKKRRKGRYGD